VNGGLHLCAAILRGENRGRAPRSIERVGLAFPFGRGAPLSLRQSASALSPLSGLRKFLRSECFAATTSPAACASSFCGAQVRSRITKMHAHDDREHARTSFRPPRDDVIVLAARWLRSPSPRLKAFVAGVTAAMGAIAGAAFVVGRRTVVDVPTFVIAAVTFAVLLRLGKAPEPLSSWPPASSASPVRSWTLTRGLSFSTLVRSNSPRRRSWLPRD
jgi:hypothetical protein